VRQLNIIKMNIPIAKVVNTEDTFITSAEAKDINEQWLKDFMSGLKNDIIRASKKGETEFIIYSSVSLPHLKLCRIKAKLEIYGYKTRWLTFTYYKDPNLVITW
jgi:hypothetical protein